MIELASDLGPAERDRAEATIAFWRGVSEVGRGGGLRDVPQPRGSRLRAGDETRLWLHRLWPLRWMVGMFLLTWVALGVLGFVAGR